MADVAVAGSGRSGPIVEALPWVVALMKATFPMLLPDEVTRAVGP